MPSTKIPASALTDFASDGISTFLQGERTTTHTLYGVGTSSNSWQTHISIPFKTTAPKTTVMFFFSPSVVYDAAYDYSGGYYTVLQSRFLIPTAGYTSSNFFLGRTSSFGSRRLATCQHVEFAENIPPGSHFAQVQLLNSGTEFGSYSDGYGTYTAGAVCITPYDAGSLTRNVFQIMLIGTSS